MGILSSNLLHEVLSLLGDIYKWKNRAVIIKYEERARKRDHNNRSPAKVRERRIVLRRSLDCGWCFIACLF